MDVIKRGIKWNSKKLRNKKDKYDIYLTLFLNKLQLRDYKIQFSCLSSTLKSKNNSGKNM